MNVLLRWISVVVAVMYLCVLSGCAVKTNSNWVGCVIRDGELAVVAPKELRLRREAIEVLKQVKPKPWQDLPDDISFATNQSVVVTRFGDLSGGVITIQSGDIEKNFGTLEIGTARFQAVDAGVVVAPVPSPSLRKHIVYEVAEGSVNNTRLHRVENGTIAQSGVAIGNEGDQLLAVHCYGAVLRRQQSLFWVEFADMQVHYITSLPDTIQENCGYGAALSADGRAYCIMFNTSSRGFGFQGSVFVYGVGAHGDCFVVEEGEFRPIAASAHGVLAKMFAKLVVSGKSNRAMIAGFDSATGTMRLDSGKITLDWFLGISGLGYRYLSPDGLLHSQRFFPWGEELAVFPDVSWSDYTMYSRLNNVPEFFVPRSWCEPKPKQEDRTEN